MNRIESNDTVIKVNKNRYGQKSISGTVIWVENTLIFLMRLIDGVWLGDNKKIYIRSTGDIVTEVPKNEYYKYLKYII